MFDPTRFVALVHGALFDPETAWDAYRSGNHGWRDTVAQLTAPLLLASMIVAGLLAWLLNPGPQFGGFGAWVIQTIAGGVTFAATVLIFTWLAGAMGGRRDFDRGTAAVSLAAVPAWIGKALATLPWIGWLISLGLSILTIVYLYRILPSYLEVPAQRRVPHFVFSVLAAIVVSSATGAVLLAHHYRQLGDQPPAAGRAEPREGVAAGRGGGLIGELQRSAALHEAAMADSYAPPADGRLERSQVAEYVRVMQRARALREQQAERMEALAAELEGKNEAGFSDLVKIYRGAGGIISIGGAATEIVKTSGGNWAEHVWVEDRLRVAKYQPDADAAAAFNRALYDEFAAELDALAAF